MAPLYIPSVCIFLLLSLALTRAVPLQSTSLTSKDLDILKLLLHQLQESVPAQTLPPDVQSLDESGFPQEAPQETTRDILSARDLKTVRQNTGSKRQSGCFGRKLDRIDSMSPLGCNTVGRQRPKQK